MEIKGVTVILYEKVVTGKDEFGADRCGENPVTVHNVLIAPISSDDVVTEQSIKSDKIVYKLAIPKGDTHTWTDCFVEFFGKFYDGGGKAFKPLKPAGKYVRYKK